MSRRLVSWGQLRGWSALWLAANLALGAVLGIRLWHGSDAARLLSTPARRLNLTSFTDSSPGTALTTLDGIEQAALFYPTRQVYTPPVMTAQLVRPDYRLTGTFIVSNRPAIAMLAQNESGSVRKVKAGDDLDGWTVLSVDASRVQLRLNEQQFEITRAAASSVTSYGGSLAGIAGPAANVAPTAGIKGTGLTRVSMAPAGTPLPTSGVQVLGHAGNALRGSSVPGVPAVQPVQPRLYRPPPQH